MWDNEGGVALESIIHIGMKKPDKPLFLWAGVVKTEPL